MLDGVGLGLRAASTAGSTRASNTAWFSSVTSVAAGTGDDAVEGVEVRLVVVD